MNTWESVEKMACRLSWGYSKKGFDFEDLLSCCKEGYFHAIRLHDTEKGAFSTYSYIWMKKYVLQYIEQQIEERNNYNTKISVEEVLPYSKKSVLPSTLIMDLKATGGDVYEIASTIMNPPEGLKLKGVAPCHLRKALMQYFKDQGWQRCRIIRAFSRLEKAIVGA